MKFKSIIEEGKVTKARRMYPADVLEGIKEYLVPYVEKNICFVVLGTDRDAFLTYNGLDPSALNSDKAIGLYSGIVKKIEREEGRLVFDIEPLQTPSGDKLSSYIELDSNLVVDFYVRGKSTFSAKDDAEVLNCIDEVLPVVVLMRE